MEDLILREVKLMLRPQQKFEEWVFGMMLWEWYGIGGSFCGKNPEEGNLPFNLTKAGYCIMCMYCRLVSDGGKKLAGPCRIATLYLDNIDYS